MTAPEPLKEALEALKKLAGTILEAFREFAKSIGRALDSIQRIVVARMLVQKKQQVPMWANDPTKTRRNRN